MNCGTLTFNLNLAHDLYSLKISILDVWEVTIIKNLVNNTKNRILTLLFNKCGQINKDRNKILSFACLKKSRSRYDTFYASALHFRADVGFRVTERLKIWAWLRICH